MNNLHDDNTPKLLHGPFNKEARLAAGMTEEYYMPFLAPPRNNNKNV
jgi:uncharacterized ferritin-like protein (DUF455 family)